MADDKVVRRGAGELEELWSGEFGDAYVGRNAPTIEARAPFWARMLACYPAHRVLEVGCANGANLYQLARLLPAESLWGADINLQALAALRAGVPGQTARTPSPGSSRSATGTLTSSSP